MKNFQIFLYELIRITSEMLRKFVFFKIVYIREF